MSLEDLPTTLCHPDPQKSCAACCGCFNTKTADSVSFDRIIRERTDLYRATAPEERSTFSSAVEPLLMDELPTCHFVGYVGDPDEKRLGCLVHPTQNDGWDGRDFGVYDCEICESYLCASHSVLSKLERWLAVNAIDNSYVYTLVISDPSFIKFMVKEVEQRLLRPVRLDDFTPKVLGRVREFFALKKDWPWCAEDGVFGLVRAGRGLATPRRTFEYGVLGLESDRVDTLLLCLGTIGRHDAVVEGRTVVKQGLDGIVESIRG